MKNQEYNQKIQDLKNAIKEKVNYQRELKRHRKTEKFEGERMKVTQKVWESSAGYGLTANDMSIVQDRTTLEKSASFRITFRQRKGEISLCYY